MDYNNGHDSGSMTVEKSDNGHDNHLGEQVLEQAAFVVHKAQDAARVAATRVTDNPLPVIVIAAGIAGIGIAGFLITRQLRKKTLDEYKMDAAKLAVRTGKKAATSALDRLDSMEIDQPLRYATVADRMPALRQLHQLAKLLRA
jgi:hypothetical protein